MWCWHASLICMLLNVKKLFKWIMFNRMVWNILRLFSYLFNISGQYICRNIVFLTVFILGLFTCIGIGQHISGIPCTFQLNNIMSVEYPCIRKMETNVFFININKHTEVLIQEEIDNNHISICRTKDDNKFSISYINMVEYSENYSYDRSSSYITSCFGDVCYGTILFNPMEMRNKVLQSFLEETGIFCDYDSFVVVVSRYKSYFWIFLVFFDWGKLTFNYRWNTNIY